MSTEGLKILGINPDKSKATQARVAKFLAEIHPSPAAFPAKDIPYAKEQTARFLGKVYEEVGVPKKDIDTTVQALLDPNRRRREVQTTVKTVGLLIHEIFPGKVVSEVLSREQESYSTAAKILKHPVKNAIERIKNARK